MKKRLTRLLEKFQKDANEQDDNQLERLHSQSVQNQDEYQKSPDKIGKYCDPPFEEFKRTRCSYSDGFSLHANVKIKAFNRTGLEHLCRYILRGALAKERISYESNGMVRLKLKTPYADGTTHLQFTPDQFIKRIIALIPPPRQNLIRYIGVFGARHKKRSIITAKASPKKEKVKKVSYRTPWAELLKYVFKYEVKYCDRCGTTLTLVATIKSMTACEKILKHLGKEVFEVNILKPRGPPDIDRFDLSSDFDQFPEYYNF